MYLYINMALSFATIWAVMYVAALSYGCVAPLYQAAVTTAIIYGVRHNKYVAASFETVALSLVFYVYYSDVAGG
jgi:hypothetical protein